MYNLVNNSILGVYLMEIKTVVEARQFNEERFTKIDMIKTRRSVAFMLNFLPGQDMRPHTHPDRELYLHVLEGSGMLSIDGKELEVNEGDVIYCEADEKIGFVNTSEDKVSIYVTMTKMDE